MHHRKYISTLFCGPFCDKTIIYTDIDKPNGIDGVDGYDGIDGYDGYDVVDLAKQDTKVQESEKHQKADQSVVTWDWDGPRGVH